MEQIFAVQQFPKTIAEVSFALKEKMESFAKIINDWKPLTISALSSIQEQPLRSVPRKKCSENMRQISA